MNLSVEELYVSYGTHIALNYVSIGMKKKEFIGVIGPNGSGKSTLLKCIYRVLKPKEGCILLNDTPLSQMSYKESAKKMAVVAQQTQEAFDFSVEEVVLMGRCVYKRALEPDYESDYEIVHQALKKVGLDGFKDRNFATLSGGERQRVILARALAQQTPCLILDEPTNHLDITHQLQFLNIVKQLDLTVIAAIHDLNLAAKYCDYIYVLHQGEIVAFGTPSEVLTKTIIQEVYQVGVEIVHDQNGQMHLLYP